MRVLAFSVIVDPTTENVQAMVTQKPGTDGVGEITMHPGFPHGILLAFVAAMARQLKA